MTEQLPARTHTLHHTLTDALKHMHASYLDYEIDEQINDAEDIITSMTDPSVEDAAEATDIAGAKIFD